MDPATKTPARWNRPYILQIDCHLFIWSVSRDYKLAENSIKYQFKVVETRRKVIKNNYIWLFINQNIKFLDGRVTYKDRGVKSQSESRSYELFIKCVGSNSALWREVESKNYVFPILYWNGPAAHFPNKSSYGRDLGTMDWQGKGWRGRWRDSQWNSEAFRSSRVPLTC